MASTYKVTGVFLSGSAHQPGGATSESIERMVVAENYYGAIAAVNSEALRAGKLFLSAKAKAVGRADSKPATPLTDNASSHLKNALQVSTLLAAELPKMIGNPGYLSDAKASLAAIDDRIRAALALAEVDASVVADIIAAAANLDTVAAFRVDFANGEHAAANLRARAVRLRAFAAKLL